MSVQSFERRLNSPTLDSLEVLSKALRIEPQILILPPAEALVGMTHLADQSPKLKASRPKSRGRVSKRA